MEPPSSGKPAARASLDPDRLVGELMPEGVEWEYLVGKYPIPMLTLAALGGFWLGYKKGPAVNAALSAFAGGEISRVFEENLGQGLDK